MRVRNVGIPVFILVVALVEETGFVAEAIEMIARIQDFDRLHWQTRRTLADYVALALGQSDIALGQIVQRCALAGKIAADQLAVAIVELDLITTIYARGHRWSRDLEMILMFGDRDIASDTLITLDCF